MNNKIFIEYDNANLANISNQLYNLFLENNYSVEILNNNIPLNEKISIIKSSTNKSIVISNKINNQNSNALEIIYPLRSTDELARTVYNKINNLISITKYYQRRDSNETYLDYYEILRNINSNEALVILYGVNTLSNPNLANLIYQGITSYLANENIYTVKSGDSIYAIARRFNTTVADIQSLNNLVTTNLSIGQKLLIPTSSQQPTTPPQEDLSSSTTNIYKVKSGDSLYSIARKYNTTVDEIKRLNNLTSNNLSINQELIIPSNEPEEEIYIVKSGDSLYSIARRFNTSVDVLKKFNNLTSNNLSIGQKLILPITSNNSPSSTIYTVKSGDSLYAIARKYNTSVDEIKKLNNLTSNNLSINQKLLIPS